MPKRKKIQKCQPEREPWRSDVSYYPKRGLPRRIRDLYLRFGKWRENEKSKNYATGKMFCGVSAYRTHWMPERQRWWLSRNSPNDSTLFSLLEEAAQGKRPILLIRGTEVGEGPDGEPLLINVKLVKGLTLADLVEDNVNVDELYRVNPDPKIKFKDETSPLDYPRSFYEHPQRLSVIDLEAPPASAGETYFARIKKGRRVIPGASEPNVVAFVDYELRSDKSVYIHYITTRRDQRGKGHMTRLLDEILRRYSDASWIDLGEIHSENVRKYYFKKRKEPEWSHRLVGKLRRNPIFKKLLSASKPGWQSSEGFLGAPGQKAHWGVYVKNKLVAKIIEVRGLWEIINPETSKRLVPKSFKTLAIAKTVANDIYEAIQ